MEKRVVIGFILFCMIVISFISQIWTQIELNSIKEDLKKVNQSLVTDYQGVTEDSTTIYYFFEENDSLK